VRTFPVAVSAAVAAAVVLTLAVGGGLVSGCRKVTPQVTGVRIEAAFPSGAFDQLTLWLSAQTGPNPTATLAEVTLPKNATVALGSPQDLVVYLDDGRAGQTLTCGVVGKKKGAPDTAALTAPVTIKAREIVGCAVSFDADAGAPGGDADAGDGGGGGTGSGGSGGTVDAAGMDAVVDAPGETAGPDAIAADAPVSDSGPETAPAASGCADGTREAFLNESVFPGIAGCGSSADGAPFTYDQAMASAGTICAAGWHWCGPGDVGTSGAAAPSTAGATCGWIESASSGCAVFQSFTAPDCAGASSSTSSVGGATSTASCLNAIPALATCTSTALKLAVSFATWATDSTGVASAATCYNHVSFACASTVASGASCLLTCCHD
jgi:hypothetical protein